DARALVEAAREALAGVSRSPTSEETELQALLKTLLPPGTPRPPTAPSKVIRLVSKFLPPAHELTMVPQTRRRTPSPSAPAAESARPARGVPGPAHDSSRARPRVPGMTPPRPAPVPPTRLPALPAPLPPDPPPL